MPRTHPDHDLIALGVRQPWAELILRGVKTIEVRTVDTRQRGTIYLYASKKFTDHPAAQAATEAHSLDLESLPRGMLVGTVDLVATRACEPDDAARACVRRGDVIGRIGWRLENPHRLPEPLPVRFLPYGVWFYPFRRKRQDPSAPP
ncbi:MAG: ASCH domain-containing protein [Planctomycetaceae bacterium]